MSSTVDVKNQFTCLACKATFENRELQRSHFKTDWHRYNLKRKVAELPPVTAESFQVKITNKRNIYNVIQEDESVYCKPCKKRFSHKNAYATHLNTKEHLEIALYYVDPDWEPKPVNSDVKEEKVESDEWDEEVENPIDNNECLFCSLKSKNFYKNLEHMTLVHSFFIPITELCIDVTGLMTYLGEKVSKGFMCLWCNEKGKTFYSIEAVRMHMVDKSHCKMHFEGVSLAEYANFYDFSSLYPKTQGENADEDEIFKLDDTGYQLILPSGATIGHRSLMRYYKQNLRPQTDVVISKNTKKLHKVLNTYRILGWTQTEQQEVARASRDIHCLKRQQTKWYTQLGIKNNKMQKHFRKQSNC